MSIAVWVGIIALAGLDAETGVVMLLYLDLAYERWQKEGRLVGIGALKEAIMFGAVKRIRPKIMTVGTILAGLIPIMFSHGAGSDVMKRIAAPMIGGVITSKILELIIYPVIYMLWKGGSSRDDVTGYSSCTSSIKVTSGGARKRMGGPTYLTLHSHIARNYCRGCKTLNTSDRRDA